jgi:hypothetical protein
MSGALNSKLGWPKHWPRGRRRENERTTSDRSDAGIAGQYADRKHPISHTPTTPAARPRPTALAGAGFATSHIAHGHAKRMRDGMRDAMVDASERLKRFRCSISTAAIKARQIKSVERGR